MCTLFVLYRRHRRDVKAAAHTLKGEDIAFATILNEAKVSDDVVQQLGTAVRSFSGS